MKTLIRHWCVLSFIRHTFNLKLPWQVWMMSITDYHCLVDIRNENVNLISIYYWSLNQVKWESYCDWFIDIGYWIMVCWIDIMLCETCDLPLYNLWSQNVYICFVFFSVLVFISTWVKWWLSQRTKLIFKQANSSEFILTKLSRLDVEASTETREVQPRF